MYMFHDCLLLAWYWLPICCIRVFFTWECWGTSWRRQLVRMSDWRLTSSHSGPESQDWPWCPGCLTADASVSSLMLLWSWSLSRRCQCQIPWYPRSSGCSDWHYRPQSCCTCAYCCCYQRWTGGCHGALGSLSSGFEGCCRPERSCPCCQCSGIARWSQFCWRKADDAHCLSFCLPCRCWFVGWGQGKRWGGEVCASCSEPYSAVGSVETLYLLLQEEKNRYEGTNQIV